MCGVQGAVWEKMPLGLVVCTRQAEVGGELECDVGCGCLTGAWDSVLGTGVAHTKQAF